MTSPAFENRGPWASPPLKQTGGLGLLTCSLPCHRPFTALSDTTPPSRSARNKRLVAVPDCPHPFTAPLLSVSSFIFSALLDLAGPLLGPIAPLAPNMQPALRPAVRSYAVAAPLPTAGGHRGRHPAVRGAACRVPAPHCMGAGQIWGRGTTHPCQDLWQVSAQGSGVLAWGYRGTGRVAAVGL